MRGHSTVSTTRESDACDLESDTEMAAAKEALEATLRCDRKGRCLVEIEGMPGVNPFNSVRHGFQSYCHLHPNIYIQVK